MNRPETEEKIRQDLKSALGRFLDSAPQGQIIARVSDVFVILKDCFELLYEHGDIHDRAKAETVLFALRSATKLFRTDEEIEQGVANAIAEVTANPATEEEVKKREAKTKEWEKLEARLKAEGKKHWWELLP